MLRCKTETRPGLVALYDIWPGNGAGLFLQPTSPHGPTQRTVSMLKADVKPLSRLADKFTASLAQIAA